jgi:DNA-directed RNA polymerase specialized sigma24 family protein
LNIALKNAPRERQAQVVAQHIISQRRKANPEMDSSDLKKVKGQALEEARLRTGAKKHLVEITDREWEAIQAGAISNDKLEKILNNTDVDKLRERATPRAKTVMTSGKTSLAKQMLSTGYTYAEIADRLGVPVSTVKSGLSEEVNP